MKKFINEQGWLVYFPLYIVFKGPIFFFLYLYQLLFKSPKIDLINEHYKGKKSGGCQI